MTTPPATAAPLPVVNADPSQDRYEDLVEWFMTRMPEYTIVKAAFMRVLTDMLREMEAKFPGSGPDGRTTREDRQFRKQVCRLGSIIQVHAHERTKALSKRLSMIKATSDVPAFP
jgi:hypothetical protein